MTETRAETPASPYPPSEGEFDLVPAAEGIKGHDLDRIAVARSFVGDPDRFYAAAYAKFTGPAWEAFAAALADVAVPFLTRWIVTGKINRLCAQKGITGTPEIANLPDGPAAAELAGLTAAEAIDRFRRRVLLTRAWTPERGASLLTFFINACLLQYRATLRRWVADEVFGDHCVEPAKLEPLFPDVADPSAVVLDGLTASAALAHLNNPYTARVLVLDAYGFKDDEIAQILGMTVGAVEQRLARHRRQLARSA
jgi:DNA-directed RNA polymerase specialized sigma24 family protein